MRIHTRDVIHGGRSRDTGSSTEVLIDAPMSLDNITSICKPSWTCLVEGPIQHKEVQIETSTQPESLSRCHVGRSSLSIIMELKLRAGRQPRCEMLRLHRLLTKESVKPKELVVNDEEKLWLYVAD